MMAGSLKSIQSNLRIFVITNVDIWIETAGLRSAADEPGDGGARKELMGLLRVLQRLRMK
ncbi:hypothetical protein [Paraburkholderia tropica]|uniref:hypothetical protein n=1 Tax=Paraburkholderia tropica TaxID=92647 RepID=UPI000A829E7C|nr:hypothetical protein [Paraburkholderia tropica]MBB2982227.1 hypothetical protein [Paraburkholderia tropica]